MNILRVKKTRDVKLPTYGSAHAGYRDFYVPNDQVDDAIAYLKENGWVHFNGYFYGIGE